MIDTDFQEPAPKAGTAPPAEVPTLATASLAFGLLTYVLLPVVGALAAIVTGHAALRKIRASGGRLGGEVRAKVGLALGYVHLALVALLVVLMLVLASITVGTARVMPLPPATTVEMLPAPTPAAPPAPPPPTSGVKMANEMGAGEFAIAEKVALREPEEEIICCYVSTSGMSPDMALLTNQRIAYIKDGRVTSIDLKDVEGVLDDEKYHEKYRFGSPDGLNYAIEVKGRSGPRMRIMIQPKIEGPPFYHSLADAWKSAGGGPGADPTSAGPATK